MLVVMKTTATQENVAHVMERIQEMGWTGHVMPGEGRTAIGITGNPGPVPRERFTSIEGVAEAISVSKPYKLVSREMQDQDTIVRVGDLEIGGGTFHVMAGPCSVESEDQIFRSAEAVAAAGATLLRGGAFKPRTSPYAFQGLKEEGLKLLEKARERTGLKIVTEVKDTETLPAVAEVADILQVGARNMQNFSLLEAVGKTRCPVLLKRGMAASVKDVLMAAEYIFSNGNQDVILCERGMRTFESATRNTFDLGGMVVLRSLTHLPVIADPSHGIGIRKFVPNMARAATAAGCDGLIIEVHPEPEVAFSDGQQSLTPEQFAHLMREIHSILPLVGQRPGT